MILDLYEQCEYKIQIIKKSEKRTRHTRHADNYHKNIDNKQLNKTRRLISRKSLRLNS